MSTVDLEKDPSCPLGLTAVRGRVMIGTSASPAMVRRVTRAHAQVRMFPLGLNWSLGEMHPFHASQTGNRILIRNWNPPAEHFGREAEVRSSSPPHPPIPSVENWTASGSNSCGIDGRIGMES